MSDTNSETLQQDPAAIEADIRRTQEDMSKTVDKIGDQLSAKNIFNALLDKADESNVDARMLIDGARRNPMALGLIAAGAIWLVSDKDSKFPSLPSRKSGKEGQPEGGDVDVHHRDYVSHMSSVEYKDGEDQSAYQRRRDMARANFLMVERGHEEDDQGFRQRLDQMTDKFREKRRAWSDSSSQAQAATRRKVQLAGGKVQEFYDSNPLVGGIIAAAAGAALGSALPITRQEQDKLGDVGDKARDLASEQKDKITSQLRETKDGLLDQADQKMSSGSETENRPTEPASDPSRF